MQRYKSVTLHYKSGVTLRYQNVVAGVEGSESLGKYIVIFDSDDGPFTESFHNLNQLVYVL